MRGSVALCLVVLGVVAVGCDPALPPEAAFLTDAGSASPDGSVDAGLPVDGGLVVDGGNSPAPDAGTMLDAGSTRPDAGVLFDAGSVMDAGPIIDAGSPEVDAGSLPVDAGSAVDAGPVPQPNGGACTSNSDCASGNCYTAAPGGYCTATCMLGGNSCPAGSTCHFVPGVGAGCLQDCATSAQCRDGYSCQPQFGGTAACLPAYCMSDNQCGSGKSCDQTQHVCVANTSCQTNSDCAAGLSCLNGQCSGSVPPPCTSDSECPAGETCSNGACSGGTSSGPPRGQVGSGCLFSQVCQQGPQPTCLTQLQDFSGGYCSSDCSQDSDCGSNNACITLLDPQGNNVPLCMENCSSNTDCRPHYNCVQWANRSFCLNACETNADCPDPQHQVCDPTTGLCSSSLR